MITYGLFSTREARHDGKEELSPTIISVPDMSYSVQEILQRFRRGTLNPMELYRESQDIDLDIDDDRFDNMDDLTDIERLSHISNDSYERLSASIRNDRGNSSVSTKSNPEGDESLKTS